MKTVMKINSILIILFVISLTFFNFKNSDSQYWDSWGKNDYSQDIYLKNTGYSGEDLFNMLSNLAQEFEVNIIKHDYLNYDNQTMIVKSIYMADDTDDLFSNDTLKKGTWLSSDNKNNEYLSSSKSYTTKSIGNIFDFLGDDYFEIWTLNKLESERGTLDGDYTIRATNTNSIDQFIAEFSYRSDISINDLTTQNAFSSIGASPIEALCLFGLVASFVLYGLMCLFYGINNSKKIGIMKLIGIKNITIWSDLVISIIKSVAISALVINILIVLLIKNLTMDFLITLFIIQIGFILLIILFSSIVYFIIKSNRISDLIKNRKMQKPIICLSYTVKYTILFVVLIFASCISSSLLKVSDEYTKIEDWKSVGDLAVLVNVNIGDDGASIMQGDLKLSEDFAGYYEYLNSKGAIYALQSVYTPHAQLKSKYIEETDSYDYVDYFNPDLVSVGYSDIVMSVNTNYLKRFPILDEDQNQIVVNENQARTILIPKTRENEADVLIDLYKSAYIADLENIDIRYGVEDNEVPNVEINYVIYEPDPSGYFAFSTEYEDSNYLIKEPIFVVLTDDGITLTEKGNILVQGINAPLKINLEDVSSSEYNNNLLDETSKFNLDDNQLKYMAIEEIFATQIIALELLAKQLSIAIIMLFIIMSGVSYQLTQEIFKVSKQKICVKKLYGYSFFDRYNKLILANVVTVIILGGLAIIIAPNLVQMTINIYSIFIVSILAIIDLLMMLVIIKYFENKSVSQVVKGE